MGYDLLWGIAFGSMELSFIGALPLMAVIGGLRSAYAILVPKKFLTGAPSKYQLFLANLGDPSKFTRAEFKQARIAFAINSIGSAVVLGSVAFGLSRWLWG